MIVWLPVLLFSLLSTIALSGSTTPSMLPEALPPKSCFLTIATIFRVMLSPLSSWPPVHSTKFRAKTGSNFTAVPYRGGALATAAVVSGEVQLAFSNMSDAMAQIAAGAVRPLAITTAKRNPQTPDIPTLIELGLVDHPVESWNGLLAPAGTPPAIVDKLAQVMSQMSKDEANQVKAKLEEQGATVEVK